VIIAIYNNFIPETGQPESRQRLTFTTLVRMDEACCGIEFSA